MKKKSLSMEVVNRYAAGIDVSSRFHYVAIGQHPQDIRKFGVYNEDLKALLDWLKENKITTVAMESTGTYWQSYLPFCRKLDWKYTCVVVSSLKTSKGEKPMYRIASGYRNSIAWAY